MHKITHILIIAAVPVFVFLSCRKPEDLPAKGPNCSPQPTKYISTEISKFKFKPGTYWVYLDSLYSAVDTMRLYEVICNGLYGHQYCPDNKHEVYSFSVNKEYYDRNRYDEYSMSEDRFMVNQLTEDGLGSIVYTSTSSKIDSMFIYDRYYKSVQVYKKGNIKYYFNSDFCLLKRETYSATGTLLNSYSLMDKVIVR